MQPGATITPGSSPVEPQQPREEPSIHGDQPPVGPVAVTAPLSSEPAVSTQAQEPAGETQWYSGTDQPPAEPVDATQPVQWQASEYIAHAKGTGWFMLVVLATIVMSGLVYLFTKEYVSAIVIGVIGISSAFFGTRPPQVLDYLLDGTGLHVGQRFYAYGIFRSFSVLQEGGAHSILLMPTQRFGLPLTIYYDPKDEQEVVKVLGANLPHEERQVPTIDRLMSKIRF